MPVPGAHQNICEHMSTFSDVVAAPHRFGGTEWSLGRREIGHIHGDSLVDIPFPKAVRVEVVEGGQAERHHILPESGWVSVWLRSAESVETAKALLSRSYELALAQRARMQDRLEIQ